MKTKIIKDLLSYIKKHREYEILAYQLSIKSGNLGFNGFSHFFQVEVSDAVAHTRRIVNYLLENNVQLIDFSLSIDNDKKIENNLKETIDNIKKKKFFLTLEKLNSFKITLLEQTKHLCATATKEGDFLTVKFYDWFLKDFHKEINFEKDLLIFLKSHNDNNTLNLENAYLIDKKLKKREEINFEKTVVSFN